MDYPGGVDDRERRLAQNEALFREVNERVEAVAHRLGPASRTSSSASARTPTAPSESCSHWPPTSASASDPKQFVVLPDHYTPEIEDLVVEEDSYWVVRKSGDAGEYVEHLDPRGR